jgi:PKD repeat protein
MMRTPGTSPFLAVLLLALTACSSSGSSGGGNGGQPGPIGAPTWSKSYGGEGDDQANAAIATADGNYLFVGIWNGERAERDVGGEEAQREYDGDVWATKLDTLGNVIWQQAYGVRRTSGPVVATQSFAAAREAADGSIWLAGTRSANPSPPGDPRSDVVVTRLAADRHPLCTQVIDSGVYPANPFYYAGDTADDSAYDVWPTTDGGALVAAWTTVIARDGNTAYPVRAPYVFKLSATCDVVWSRRVRDDELRYVRDQPAQLLVREASGGGAAMALNAVVRPTGSGGTFFELRVARFDAGGAVLWSQSFHEAIELHDMIQIDGDVDGADDDGFVLVGAQLWGGSPIRGVIMRIDDDGNGDVSDAWTTKLDDAAVLNAVIQKCHRLASGERICNYRAVGRAAGGGGYAAFVYDDGALSDVAGTRRFPQFESADDIRLRQDGPGALSIYFDIVGRRSGGSWIATVNNILGDVSEPGLHDPRLIDHEPGEIEFTPGQGLLDRLGHTISRLTWDGVLEWSQSFDSTAERRVERAYFVTQTDDNGNGRLDADDGYLVAGESTSDNADPNEAAATWLLKLDANGGLVWQRLLEHFTACGSRDRPAEAVAAVPGGGYVVAGFDGAALRLAVLDANGDVRATTTPLTSLVPRDFFCDVRVASLVRTADAGFAVAIELPPGGVLLKLDANAEPVWRKRIDLYPSIVRELEGGALVVAGSHGSLNVPGLIKFTSSGDLAWSRDYEFGLSVFGDHLSLAALPNGDLYLAVTQMDGSPGATPAVLASQGFRNVLLFKTDADGEVRWGRIYGAAFDEDAFAVAASPDDGAIIAGRSLSFGDRSEAWLLRIGPDGMVSEGCNALRAASAAVSAIPVSALVSDYTPNLRPEDMHTLALVSRATQAPRFSPQAPVVARQCEGNARTDSGPPAPRRTFHLTVTQGNVATSGVVTSTPAGILCGTAEQGGGACGGDFVADSTVFLKVDPGDLPRLRSWGGCDRITVGQCEVYMGSDREVVTTFLDPNAPVLRFSSVVGLGRVSDGSQLSCRTGLGGTCSQIYNPGQIVTLTAEPDPGEYFIGWGGDCAAAGSVRTTQLALNANLVCSAEFSGATVGSPRLTITAIEPQALFGTVTSTPIGIVCGYAGSDCSGTFPVGTRVRLEAVPVAPNFEFERFLCDQPGIESGHVIEVALLADLDCVARFSLDISRLEVLIRSDDPFTVLGRVYSTPAGLDCNADCDRPFTRGQLVTLHAEPAFGRTLTGWDGCDSVHVDTQNPGGPLACDVLVDRARSVVAFFNRLATNRHALVVEFDAGSADGSVTTNRSLGSNIACTPAGGVCDALYVSGDEAVLYIVPAAGNSLAATSGCDQLIPAQPAVPAECHVMMTAPKVVRLRFSQFDAPPVPSFDYSPGAPVVNQTVTFDGSFSTDDNNGIVSYSWDFQDDGIFDASGVQRTFTYTAVGNYTVRLRVTDTLGRTADATRVVPVGSPGGGSTLTLTIRGNGNGVVSLAPEQTACSYSGNFGPTTCSWQYPTGTAITLTALAYTGYVVGDWVHCDALSADGSQCFVNLSSNRSVEVYILQFSP